MKRGLIPREIEYLRILVGRLVARQAECVPPDLAGTPAFIIITAGTPMTQKRHKMITD
jgi:hypothetical protein